MTTESTLVTENTNEKASNSQDVGQNASPKGSNNKSQKREWSFGGRRDRGPKKDAPKKEFNEVLLEVRRVTKVTTWGRRMNFRATILIGNLKGKIGIGTAKGKDVSIAVKKATHDAYKHIAEVPVTEHGSIPYPIMIKNKASAVKLLPASAGTGLKAGSSVRTVLELAGYSNILSKILWSNNKLNTALTTVKALTEFKQGKKTPSQKKTADK